MKKILFLINTLGMGGAEHVLVDIVNQLDPDKFDITIKTIYDINVFEKQINKNIKIDTFYKSKKNKLVNRICQKILYEKLMNYSPKKLYKMLIKDKYDIEVAFLEGIPTKIISGSDNKDSQKIAWVHIDLKCNKESFNFYKNLKENKEVYEKYNSIFCVSETALKSFQDIFQINDKTSVVYNIINKEKISKLSKEKIKLKSCFNLINVGRLTEQKGQVRLLEAYYKALKQINIETHLYIAGEGEKREEIEKKIQELHLENYVTLLGNQSNPYKYLKNCNLYVCSSYAEGYSLVIMESVFLHLPVLTTDCAGQNQILHNGDFGLIVNNDTESLTKGLIKLINNPKLINKYRDNIEKNYEKYENNIKDIEDALLK